MIINAAYITAHGYTSVGIRSQTITVSNLGFDPDDVENGLKWLREHLAQSFADIMGEKPSVMFDFEVKRLEKEMASMAGDQS